MDPATVVGTLYTVATTAAAVSKQVLDFINEFKSAPSAILAVRKELSALQRIVTQLEGTLFYKFKSNLPLAADMTESLREALNDCNGILLELDSVMKKFVSKENRTSADEFWMRMKWLFEKEDVIRIRKELEKHTSTLNTTLLVVVHVATHGIRHDTESIASLMSELLNRLRGDDFKPVDDGQMVKRFLDESSASAVIDSSNVNLVEDDLSGSSSGVEHDLGIPSGQIDSDADNPSSTKLVAGTKAPSDPANAGPDNGAQDAISSNLSNPGGGLVSTLDAPSNPSYPVQGNESGGGVISDPSDSACDQIRDINPLTESQVHDQPKKPNDAGLNRPVTPIFRDDTNSEGDGRPLILAIRKGDMKVASLLLKFGANVNAKGDYGGTALQNAASRGNINAVRFLIDCRANVNAPGEFGITPLKAAIEKGSYDIMQLLLENGADPKEADLLQFAVHLNRLSMVERLLAAGADVNAKGIYGRTALQEAISSGNINIVHVLLNIADLNTPGEFGKTPLKAAIEKDNYEIMQLLLENRADPKEADLLQFAVHLNRLSMVERLLAAGADVNAKGIYGRTALQEAISSGHINIVHVLLNIADLNAPGEFGKTPLRAAIEKNDLDMINLLLEKGALPS